MDKFLKKLTDSGKVAAVTLKNDKTLKVTAVVDNIYTLANGEEMYIAPDQIVTIADGSPDEKLGF
ncbi:MULTISPECIES: hypothetical protein [Streptococcus]|uniref:hypothetical protein n=1 Tax=Streptococcus TaxID=1301 RepID=UPI001C8DE5CC|nr:MULTISPECIES: hypothetical protein [Streptococcus]MBY0719585.1 hypothetical protein [Streptococcus sp. 2018110]MCO8235100.1 hypothetical protein [Streptococcus suis]HEM3552250.1 hypothetical protein [Streptococcus suis]